MPTVRAKFTVESKLITNHGAPGTPMPLTTVKLKPVMANSAENKEFWKWSPNGVIELATLNPAAADALELGREYYIDFTPA